MNERIIERIVRLYGVEPHLILEPKKGYRNQSWPVETNDFTFLNVIVFKHEPGIVHRIKRADRVAQHLAAHQMPTRVPLDNRLVRLKASSAERFARAYNYLPGTTIPWEAYTQKHLRLLGETMSDMHSILASYDHGDLPDVTDEYLATLNRMHKYFGTPDIAAAIHTKLGFKLAPHVIEELQRILTASKGLQHRQALHMDFVRSNILFETDGNGMLNITGILDLEKTAAGHPMFDIARTLAFLLVDCKYKPADKVRKYFLRSGYHKYGSSNYRKITVKYQTKRADLLEKLIDLFLLHDFYKFLKHNPYESLAQNEHFVRTRDLLLERQLLTVV